MAGYRVPRRTALLRFEGSDYDGAEIRCKLDVPTQLFFDIWAAQSQSKGDDPAVIIDVNRLWVEKALIEWNLEDEDGTPVPATIEGLLAQPPAFVSFLLSEWLKAVSEPPANFTPPSLNGDTLAAARTEGETS